MPRPETHELASAGVAPTACAAASTTGKVPPTPATVATSAAVAVGDQTSAHSHAFARSTIACSRIWQPAPISTLLASSISLWLMPSLHGTKTIAVGATRET